MRSAAGKVGIIMNKKLFAAVFSTVLLCSCGNGGMAEVPETTAESVAVTSAASEKAVTAAAAETASDPVSEVSKTERKEAVTRDFFNDDVVFEEILLPVKVTYYRNGVVDGISEKEYDAAGNIICEDNYTTYEYDYTPDGTYNSVTMLHLNGKKSVSRFDENGYCIEHKYHGITDNRYKYEYEFDEAGRLIRKTAICDYQKDSFEYTYDEMGRIYEEFNNTEYYSSDRLVCNRYRHEYGDGFEKVYYLPDGGKEELYKTTEKDENGNIIKETLDYGVISGTAYGYRDYEYKYDGSNRLIYEKSVYPEAFGLVTTTTEYFYDDKDRLVKEFITTENETGGNKITHSTLEYIYNDNNGSMLSKYNGTYGTRETEYAMIPKIKTGIEYKYFYEVEP